MAASYELQLSDIQKAIVGRVAVELKFGDHPSLQIQLLCLLSFDQRQQIWFREPLRWRELELEPVILPVAYLFVLAEAWSEVQALVDQFGLLAEQLGMLASWCLTDRHRVGFEWLVTTYAIDTYLLIEEALLSSGIRNDISQGLFLRSLQDTYGDEFQQASRSQLEFRLGLELASSSSDEQPSWDTDY